MLLNGFLYFIPFFNFAILFLINKHFSLTLYAKKFIILRKVSSSYVILGFALCIINKYINKYKK